jgi:hypothetical protein
MYPKGTTEALGILNRISTGEGSAYPFVTTLVMMASSSFFSFLADL